MNQFKILIERHQKEFDALPIRFAFSDEQFAAGMRELGLSPSDTDRIVSIGYGGFMKKEASPLMHEVVERHRKEMDEAIAADKTGEGFICDMFEHELANHEYTYTRDVSDTLAALGYNANSIAKNPVLRRGLELAIKKQIEWSEAND